MTKLSMDKIPRDKKSPVTLKITGMFLSESYQQCKIFASKLRKHHKKYFRNPVIKGFLEVDWIAYLDNLHRTVGGQTWSIRKGVVVYIDDVFIGGDAELFDYYRTYEYIKPSAGTITNIAKQEYLDYLNLKKLLYTFMEFSLGEEYMGTLMFELQVDLLPKTCSRFAFFCGSLNCTGISYKMSPVFRICKNGWFQAGRVRLEGKHVQEDESFCYTHDRRGIVSFAKNGKYSNNAEFIVTFGPSRWMDQHYVAFGRVVEGWDLLRQIENMPCTYESPNKEIVISNCGLVEAGFGRHTVTKQRIKGITVGDPHLDLEMFNDLIFSYFDTALFDRLDEEVRCQLNAEWVALMIWDKVEPFLNMRQPIEDWPDLNDASSKEYLPERYFTGLYSLFNEPGHYIREMLNGLLNEGLYRREITTFAENIVNLILNSIENKSDSELAAENFLEELISNVNNFINGHDEAKKSFSMRLSETLSCILSKDLSTKTSSMVNTSIMSVSDLSLNNSLADYIWGILINKITMQSK